MHFVTIIVFGVRRVIDKVRLFSPSSACLGGIPSPLFPLFLYLLHSNPLPVRAHRQHLGSPGPKVAIKPEAMHQHLVGVRLARGVFERSGIRDRVARPGSRGLGRARAARTRARASRDGLRNYRAREDKKLERDNSCHTHRERAFACAGPLSSTRKCGGAEPRRCFHS